MQSILGVVALQALDRQAYLLVGLLADIQTVVGFHVAAFPPWQFARRALVGRVAIASNAARKTRGAC